jgi:hypothetical protein
MRSISKRVAWLALALTIWSAFAFALHHHSTQDESAACQVCIAAHSASPANHSLAPKPVFRRVASFRPQTHGAKQHLTAFLLYVRPPPAV